MDVLEQHGADCRCAECQLEARLWELLGSNDGDDTYVSDEQAVLVLRVLGPMVASLLATQSDEDAKNWIMLMTHSRREILNEGAVRPIHHH